LLCCTGFLASCAFPRAAYKPGFDFSRIRTVRIGDFSSVGQAPNSGAVVANEFIRQLLAAGYSVTDSNEADVVLIGTVNEYQPNRRYLINTGQGNGDRRVVVMQQPVELSGNNAYDLGSAFGLGDDNKIIVSNATVGVSAYLKDEKNGEIIWSNSYSYEGLDMSTALDGTVRYLLRSLPRDRQ
jgi:hypothetical protein